MESIRPQPPSAILPGNGEKAKLIQILKQTDGNQSEAARRLGVSRVTVWKRIKKYGLDLKKEIPT